MSGEGSVLGVYDWNVFLGVYDWNVEWRRTVNVGSSSPKGKSSVCSMGSKSFFRYPAMVVSSAQVVFSL